VGTRGRGDFSFTITVEVCKGTISGTYCYLREELFGASIQDSICPIPTGLDRIISLFLFFRRTFKLFRGVWNGKLEIQYLGYPTDRISTAATKYPLITGPEKKVLYSKQHSGRGGDLH
jgi:hypothetical protein